MPTRPPPAKIKSVIAKCLIAAFCLALAAPSDAAAQTAPVTAGHFGVPVSDWTGAYVGGHIGADGGDRTGAPAGRPSLKAVCWASAIRSILPPAPAATSKACRPATILSFPPASWLARKPTSRFPTRFSARRRSRPRAWMWRITRRQRRAVFRHPARAARLRLRPLARLRYRRLRMGRRPTDAHAGVRCGSRHEGNAQVVPLRLGGRRRRRNKCRQQLDGRTSNISSPISARRACTFPAGAQTFSSDLTLQNRPPRAQLSAWRAGSGNRSVLPASHIDDWAIHAQTTYLIQTDPDFRSPYVGQHSLIPGQSRETWDATFYLGLRLWHGAELWVDPEIDQGFGLSDTLGVAGFPSGEAYKIGNSYPYARLPRYFIRDTVRRWQTEKLEAGANQSKGAQTENRLYLRSANLASPTCSTPTVRARSARRLDELGVRRHRQFRLRGGCLGLHVWGRCRVVPGAWTLRAGVFDLSIEPNSEVLDPDFSQYQLIAELEHRHELWGEPGKLAITGLVSRAAWEPIRQPWRSPRPPASPPRWHLYASIAAGPDRLRRRTAGHSELGLLRALASSTARSRPTTSPTSTAPSRSALGSQGQGSGPTRRRGRTRR